MKGLAAVYHKEMLEILRDKRTLVVMLLMPVLVIPLIFDTFMNFSIEKSRQAAVATHKAVLLNGDAVPDLAARFANDESYQIQTGDWGAADIKAAIRKGDLDVGLVFPEDGAELLEYQYQVRVEVIYDNASITSHVYRRAQQVINEYNNDVREARLIDLGLRGSQQREALLEPAVLAEVGTATFREVVGERAGGMLPYLFIMFCFMAAIHAALDLGVGEKERGTLETLLLTPVPRVYLVLGKYLAVFTVAVTASMITVASIAGWIGLRAGAVSGEMGDMLASIGFLDLVLIALMLVPIAALFSSVQLSMSIYAKSFKEAQTLMSSSVILVLIPAMAAVLPGVELKGGWIFVPITNVALAIKELAKGTINYSAMWGIFGSTALLAGLGIAFCVHWFQREDVLFRS